MAETKIKKPAGPSTLSLVVEAITNIDDRKGASIPAIKAYILEKYPERSVVQFKSLLKKAINRGTETGVLVRPAKDETSTGLTGRLRINKQKTEVKPKKKVVKKSLEKPTTAKSTKTPKMPKTPMKKKPVSPKKKTTTKTASVKKATTKKASTKKSPKAKKATPKAKATKATTPSKSKKTTPKAGAAKAKK